MALHVIEAKLVQHMRNGDLVLEGKIDAGRLRTIAQGRVEEGDALFGHVLMPKVPAQNLESSALHAAPFP